MDILDDMGVSKLSAKVFFHTCSSAAIINSITSVADLIHQD